MKKSDAFGVSIFLDDVPVMLVCKLYDKVPLNLIKLRRKNKFYLYSVLQAYQLNPWFLQ